MATLPKVVCLGMNEESAVAISRLIQSGADIVAIVGVDNRQSASIADYYDLSQLAKEHDLRWIPVSDVNADETIADLGAMHADWLFVTGWSQLLSKQVLDLFPSGVVGSHPSELPYGRGRAPLPWTILEGIDTSAVSLFKMEVGVDSGSILKQLQFDVPKDVYARELYELVSHNLAIAFVDLYWDIVKDQVTEVVQDIKYATWRSKRIPADGCINFNHKAEDIYRLVRAVSDPYPGAYSYFNSTKVIFNKAQLAEGADIARKGVPGQVLARRDGMILVQALDSGVWLEEPIVDPSAGKVCLGDTFGFRVHDEIARLLNRISVLEEQLARKNSH